MTQVDLLIKNGHVFNVFLRKFVDTQVTVKNGKFYWINQNLPGIGLKRQLILRVNI